MTNQEDSNPDPEPLKSLRMNKRELLALLGLGSIPLLAGTTQPVAASHKSDAPFPEGGWGVEILAGHGTTDRPSTSTLDDAWSETYHYIFVDVDTGDRYYAEKDDTSWTELDTNGGSGGGNGITKTTARRYGILGAP